MATKNTTTPTAVQAEVSASTPAAAPAQEPRVRVRILKNATRAAGAVFARGATPRLSKTDADTLVALGAAEIIGA